MVVALDKGGDLVVRAGCCARLQLKDHIALSRFGGFPPQLFDFFQRLEKDNSKAFWSANKDVWENQVRLPLLAALDDLAAEFGPLRMFRPNRDVRFAKDKSPYKLWAGATSESRAVGGIGYYPSVSASVLTVGYGAMAMATDQLQRFRAALAVETSGIAFERVVAALAGGAGYQRRRTATKESTLGTLVNGSPLGVPTLEGGRDCAGV